MRTIEELRELAKEMNKSLEVLLYEMLNDAISENQKYKEVIDKAIEFLKGFHNYEKRFKWCEQDYIDTIEELEKILKEVE